MRLRLTGVAACIPIAASVLAGWVIFTQREPAVPAVDINVLDVVSLENEHELHAMGGESGSLDDALQKRLAGRKPLAGIERMASNHADTIEDYHEGRLRLGQNEPVDFILPFDWARSDRGLNYLAELHSLRFLTNFAREGVRSGKHDYFDIVDQVLLDWVQKNPLGAAAHKRAWHEGAVAKRTLVLLNLLNAYLSVEQPQEVSIGLLMRLIHQHCEFLARDKTYRPRGNHGIRQDLSLLAVSLSYPEFERAAHWRQTALNRLRTRQIETGFSKEGVWLEHSPTYHGYVMALIQDILAMLDDAGVGEEAVFLRTLSAQSETYLSHVLTPAGLFPPVGDSDEDRPVPSLVQSPAALYTYSRGREGSPPQQLDGFFPGAGEAIFRDTWGRPDRPAHQAIYIHVHAAYHHGLGHRHSDDLSFVMHGLGRWWVLEGGKHGYDEGATRQYLISAQAHNGVTFNHQSMAPQDWQVTGKTTAFDDTFVSQSHVAAARARTTRFVTDGVRATRTYVFLRERQTLVLLDQLNAPVEGDWQSYVHLAPDLLTQTEGTTVTATASEQSTVRLDVVFEAGKTSSVQVVSGQTEPMQGWYSPGFLKLVPSPAILSERRGADVTMATIIRLADAGAPPVTDLATTCSGGGGGATCRISWDEGQDRLNLELSTGGPLSVDFSRRQR